MPASLAASSRGRPSRALASASRAGAGEQAGADPAVALAAGEAAQLGRVVVGTDRQGCGHGGSSEDNAAATPQAPDRSVTSSAGRYEAGAFGHGDRVVRLPERPALDDVADLPAEERLR